MLYKTSGRGIGWRVLYVAARTGLVMKAASASILEVNPPSPTPCDSGGPADFSLSTYHLVGVSGGLQDGFAARHWLDYHHGETDENKAVLVGSALVKGYKAFLDVKQKGWREHVAEPGHPLVNPVVVPTGCGEHANVYAIYAVDSRQVLKALLSEPRFLSMTPDTGLVDLTADETGRSVRTLARHQAAVEGKHDLNSAAFLLVTGVWAPGSLIESPVLYTKEDGTQVTDFPGSVALWAGTTDGARQSTDETERAGYWASFRQAIREAELWEQEQPTNARATAAGEAAAAAHEKAASSPSSGADGRSSARPLSACRTHARYGVGPETVRMGREYTAAELLAVVPEAFGASGGMAAAGAAAAAVLEPAGGEEL